MNINRREFIQVLSAAGVSALACNWLAERALALAGEGALAVEPGPGIETWVPTTCGLCQGGCGIELRLIDGLPVGVRGNRRHLVSRGRMCSLGHSAIQTLFGRDRISRPLKRQGRRGQGLWAEISWQEAQDLIEKELKTLITGGLAHRIAFLDGRLTGLGQQVARRFMRSIGSPHYIVASEDPGGEMARQMFGWERAPGADLERSRMVVLFRFDHLECDGSPVWQSGVYARARDRTIDRPIYVSVGPRLLGSAAKSDMWLPARPATEGVVAFAMAQQILNRGGENREFLERSTNWQALLQAGDGGLERWLAEITPDVAARVSGVPAHMIERVADNFVRQTPAVALAGPGTAASPTGELTHLAVNLLNALVGAVNAPGGLVELKSPTLAEVCRTTDRETSSEDESQAIRTPQQLAEALLREKPNALALVFIRDANPVYDSPLRGLFRRGLASPQRLLVAFATEMNETAEMADIVLPEPTFLERWDIITGTPVFPRSHASLQRPVISPLFGARQSEQVLAELTASLGELARGQFVASTPEDLARHASRGLFDDPNGVIFDAAAPPQAESIRPRALDRFWDEFQEVTVWAVAEIPSSGEVRRPITLIPRQLRQALATRHLGDLVIPSFRGDPHRYPDQLVVFQTAQLRDGHGSNLPMMMELAGHWGSVMWASWAEMHPRTAAAAGIRNGDRVRVVSETGHIDAIAFVSPATPPGTVALPLGYGHATGSTAGSVGGNVNDLLAGHKLPAARPRMRETVTRLRVVKI